MGRKLLGPLVNWVFTVTCLVAVIIILVDLYSTETNILFQTEFTPSYSIKRIYNRVVMITRRSIMLINIVKAL